MKTEKLEIKKLGINGEGIGYINRKITFVRGALPEEEVEVEIVNETKNFKEGQLTKVLKKSNHRVKPECPLIEFCLGCPLLHLDYSQQLYYKKDIIRDSINRYTSVNLKKIDFRRCQEALKKDHYKDTVHLPIVRFHHRLKFGIFQRGSKYLTIMNNCGMQNPLINRCLNDLENILNEQNAHAFSDETRTGLRFLTARVFDNSIQLIFVTGRDRLDDKIIDEIEKLDYVSSVYYTINVTKNEDFTKGRYEKVLGSTRQEFKLLDQKMIISPKSEYPINPSMVPTTIELVNSLISKTTKSILEINCGIGWLSLNLPEFIEVKGIDYNRSNIDDAKMNARFLRKNQCSFESGKIDELIKTLTKNKDYDTFIVHSPRLGMRNSVKESLIKGKIKELIYISSSPSSFAKDIADLEKYYVVETIIPVDEMPHSQNVKVIAKLRWR